MAKKKTLKKLSLMLLSLLIAIALFIVARSSKKDDENAKKRDTIYQKVQKEIKTKAKDCDT